jgi:hypothetical protein
MDEQQQETQPVKQVVAVYDTFDGGIKRTTIVMDGDDTRRVAMLLSVANALPFERDVEINELRHAAARGWAMPAPIGGSVDSAANREE